MRVILTITALVLTLSVFADESELKGFKTDYCTNYPEGTRENPEQWKHCCLFHDMYFWAGGNKQDRYEADLGLRSCIEETGAFRIARLMYYAVRAGSHSPYKYPDKKWGNGWKNRPGFQSLSSEELSLIETELNSGYDFITAEQKQKFLHTLHSRAE